MCSEDVKQFSELLKEHQKATLADGFSVLESAVIQHNLRSVSNMYRNIAVDQLARLLGLSEEKVEALACDMILQRRLRGHIDQVRALCAALCVRVGPTMRTALPRRFVLGMRR